MGPVKIFSSLRNVSLLKLSVCICFEVKTLLCTDLCAVGGTVNRFEFISLDFNLLVLDWSFVVAAAPVVVEVVAIVGRRFLINEESIFLPFLILKSTASFSFVNTSPFVFKSGASENKCWNVVNWQGTEWSLYRLFSSGASWVESNKTWKWCRLVVVENWQNLNNYESTLRN